MRVDAVTIAFLALVVQATTENAGVVGMIRRNPQFVVGVWILWSIVSAAQIFCTQERRKRKLAVGGEKRLSIALILYLESE
jgi:hypothetical protein